MEQKETIHKFQRLGETTLRIVLQMLGNLSTDKVKLLIEKHQELQGETNLYTLLNRQDPVTSQYLDQKVNLEHLKSYLEEQGLPFAFKKTSEGTNFFFRVKDEALANRAVENVLKDLFSNPQAFAKRVLRKPEAMTFDEKVAYARKQHYQTTNRGKSLARSIPRKVR
ncbi:Protein of unknown function [Pilibacter termitis]|uniref:PcfB protein n=1 Tax=Pilibacter termitis TaxID=263852 RepID=A0A1T4KT48_9ENTE|nr:DUF3801 domain-containing protein [Pilibacter termitis]SJZ45615.1 Protein of unknown function [Pilibacter termitis]